MADRVIANLARERDRALRRLQVLAAEIRAHEETARRTIASSRRPADQRLYRRLRQVNGGRHDEAGAEVAPVPAAFGVRREG